MKQENGHDAVSMCVREKRSSNTKDGHRARDANYFNRTRAKGDKSVRTAAHALPCTRVHVENNIPCRLFVGYT
jgi:hypothetical protein